MAKYSLQEYSSTIVITATEITTGSKTRLAYCEIGSYSSSGNPSQIPGQNNSSGTLTFVIPISDLKTMNNGTYNIYVYFTGIDGGSTYTRQSTGLTYTVSGSSGGGGGTVTPEPDDDDISAPIFSNFAVTNVHRDGNDAVFNFEIQIRNPNSTDILVRTQCDFGTDKTYYAPKYNGSGDKANRVQNPGIGNGYYKVSSTAGNYDIYYYVGSATSVQVTAHIYIYYGKVSEGKVNYNGPQVTRTFTLDVPNAYSDFTWGDGSTTISTNDTFSTKVTAAKWKELIGLVNKVKGTSISTTGVSTGNALTATSFNNVVSALGLTSTIGTKSKGDKCLASDFNKIRTAYRKAAGLE